MRVAARLAEPGFYYSFGEPVDLADLDSKDKDRCLDQCI